MSSEPDFPPGALGRAGAELLSAAMALSSERELEELLPRVASEARRVLRTRYAALAIYGHDGTLWRFVQDGLTADDAALIGSCPIGRGLLAAVQDANGPIRVADLRDDPRSYGFPEGHPSMRHLLGAPVATGRRRHGSLYLCDRVDGAPFDEEDEATVGLLAQLAATMVETALSVRADHDRIAAQGEAAALRARELAQRELLGRVIAAQEAERARVSRDLHDEIGQALTSVLLGLRLIEDTGAEHDDNDQRVQLSEVRTLVTDALDQVRALAFDLRPTVLDDVGLVPAVERLVTDLQDRSEVSIRLHVAGLSDTVRLAPEIETVLYRVVQEALTNVIRHAAGGEASVQIVAEPERVRAVVEDDGQGFEVGRHNASLGLAGMRERAVLAGGSLRVESEPGRGTTVMVEVPRG